MARTMNQALVCRKLAEKWLEIACEVENPALKKCYIAKALRYRALAAMYARGRPGSRQSLAQS